MFVRSLVRCDVSKRAGVLLFGLRPFCSRDRKATPLPQKKSPVRAAADAVSLFAVFGAVSQSAASRPVASQPAVFGAVAEDRAASGLRRTMKKGGTCRSRPLSLCRSSYSSSVSV